MLSSQLSWQFLWERPVSQWDRVLSIEFPVRVIASEIDEVVILFRACELSSALFAKMSCQVVTKLVTFVLRGNSMCEREVERFTILLTSICAIRARSIIRITILIYFERTKLSVRVKKLIDQHVDENKVLI